MVSRVAAGFGHAGAMMSFDPTDGPSDWARRHPDAANGPADGLSPYPTDKSKATDFTLKMAVIPH